MCLYGVKSASLSTTHSFPLPVSRVGSLRPTPKLWYWDTRPSEDSRTPMDNPFSFQWNEMQTLGSQTIHDDDAAQFQGVQMEDTSMDPIDTNLLGPTAPSGIGAMGNNDYMLFLNLATPTSTTAVDELHAREKEEMEQSHLDVPDDNAAYCKVGGPAPPPCTGGDATDGPEADGEAGAEHARARENVRVHHEDPQNHNSSNTADHAHDGPYSNDSNDIDTGKDLADVALMPKFDFADAVISETQLELIINSSANHPKKQQHVRNTPHLSYSVSNPIPSTCDRSRINSVEFTPLLSPMINPSLERINSNKGKTGFSPLSSPVLEFKKYNHASTLRQKRKEGPNEKFNSSFDVNHSNNNNNNNNNNSSSNNNSNSKNSDNNNDNHQNPDNDSESVNNPNKTRANVKSDKYSWHIENNSSDTFNNMNDDDSDNRSFKRSKTPVTTPLLTATDPRRQKSITSKNSSNSPSLTAQSTPFQNYVFKQRQFNNLNSNSNSKEPPVSTTSVHPDFTNNSFLDAFEGDLTLPPPPNSTSTASATNISPTTAITGAAAGNNDFSCFQSLNSRSSDPSVATPATLMSLNSTPNMYPTKPRKSNVLLNPNHHKSAQSSPVILPSSSIALDLPKLEFKMVSSSEMKPFSGSSSAATPNIKPNANLKNPSNFGIGVGTSILDSKPQTSLSTPSNSSSSFSTQHYHSDKKMSHKLAEQGRRNRMNIAIQELDKLIPESMKRDITVPSKATTVELGCKYILELLELLHNSQKRPTSSPGPHSHPDPNPNPHINSNSTSGSAVESISPLDGMDSNDRP